MRSAPTSVSPRWSRALAGSAVAALLAIGCGSTNDDATTDTDGRTPVTAPGGGTVPGADPDPVGSVNAVTFTAVPVGSFDIPIMLLPRSGDDHLWLAERAGTIRRLAVGADGALTPAGDPVLDLTEQTTTDMERGLLGLAFTPDGDTLFVSHTDPEGHSRVASYAVTTSEAGEVTVDASGRSELLFVEQPYSNHNGGHLVWGPDDALWLGLGDGGAADDPANHGQTDDTILATMVRVDLSGDENHEVAVTGLRNPWRFDFDADGGLWIADVGQNEVEEVNHLPAGEIDGSNLGWSGYEGSRAYLDGEDRRPDDPIMPVFEYFHDRGCSITGGVIYRGSAIPELAGAFLYSDYCQGQVHALTGTGDQIEDHDLGFSVEAPISFGTNADGEAYVLSASGPIVRISAD